MRSGNVQIQERDREILRHVARYRLTTANTLHQLFFPGSGQDAVKGVLRRLRGRFLQDRPLYGRRVYYQLTSAAARSMGMSDDLARPLGPQALPTAYGVLAYCCHGTNKRQRLIRSDWQKHYPQFLVGNGRLPSGDFYHYRKDGKTILARIVVDLDPRRFDQKLRTIIKRSMRRPEFVPFIDDGAFALAVVTSEETKREQVRQALLRRPLHALVRIAVVPELSNLIARRA